MGTRNKPLSPADKTIISLGNAATKLCLLKKEGAEFTDKQKWQIDEQLLRIMKATGIKEIREMKKKQKRQTQQFGPIPSLIPYNINGRCVR